MDLWMNVGNGKPVNVGTFDGATSDEARAALADLLSACAEALRSDVPLCCLAPGRPGEER